MSVLVVPPRKVGRDFPSFFHLTYSAVAANITSPEELSAVSTESCTTPMMKPTPTTCMATSALTPQSP